MEALTQEYLLSIIDARNVNELRNIFNEYNSVDIADLLKELPINKTIYAFTTVPSSLTADVFAYLDDEYQQSIIEALKDADLKISSKDNKIIIEKWEKGE